METIERLAIDFTSTVSWDNVMSDTLIIHCSDPRFQWHFNDLVKNHLKIMHQTPFILPGGITLLLPLMGRGFKMGKQALGFILDKKGIKKIICIAHEDCVIYQEDSIINWVLEHTKGKTIRELQIEHLQKAGDTFNIWFPGVKIDLYYAAIEESKGGKVIVFSKVE